MNESYNYAQRMRDRYRKYPPGSFEMAVADELERLQTKLNSGRDALAMATKKLREAEVVLTIEEWDQLEVLSDG